MVKVCSEHQYKVQDGCTYQLVETGIGKDKSRFNSVGKSQCEICKKLVNIEKVMLELEKLAIKYGIVDYGLSEDDRKEIYAHIMTIAEDSGNFSLEEMVMIKEINEAITISVMKRYKPIYIELSIRASLKLSDECKRISGKDFYGVINQWHDIPIYIDLEKIRSTLIAEVDGFIKKIPIGKEFGVD